MMEMKKEKVQVKVRERNRARKSQKTTGLTFKHCGNN